MWSLYATLNLVKPPEKVSSLTVAGTCVVMRSPDGCAIAREVVALDWPAKFEGINPELSWSYRRSLFQAT